MPSDREILRRSQERRKKRRIAKLVFWLLLFGLIFYLSILFFSWSALCLEKVKVEGNYTVSSEAITNRAKELLAGKYLGLYSRDHVLLWPKTSIEAGLAQSFPRLKNIELRTLDRETLLVKVDERIPVFSWCHNTDENGNPSNCQLVDKTGHSCGSSPIFSESVYPVLSGDFVSGSSTDQLLSTTTFPELATFVLGLREELRAEAKPLGLYRIVFLGDDDYAALVALNGETDNPWRVVFNIKTPAADLINNFLMVFKSDLFRGELQKNDWELDYIDLRFGKKIFYKFL